MFFSVYDQQSLQQQQIFSFNGYCFNLYNIKYNGETERGKGEIKNIKSPDLIRVVWK